MRHWPIIAAIAWLSASAAVADEPVEDITEDAVGTLEWGALLGGGFFQINPPDDPPDSYTFLFGSGFSGGGFVGGLTALFDLESIPLGFGIDVLFSVTSLTGFAEADGARREVTLKETALRVWLPSVRTHVTLPFGQWELGLGPEFVVGLSTDATESLEGIEPDDTDIETESDLWVFVTVQTGITFEIDGFGPFEQVAFPVLLRAGWNPGYPDQTSERFADFDGPEAPGPLTLGSEWYVAGLAGIRFGHLLY